MKYMCEFVGSEGRFNEGLPVVIVDRDYAIKHMSPKGYTEDLTEHRNRGALVHRAELDNQPEFDGYCGPMWDGTKENDSIGILRYETWETYDMLSR